MSRQSSNDIDSDRSSLEKLRKIKNYDTLTRRLEKYSSISDRSENHKSIFLANDEDESSDEELDLSDECEEAQDYARSEETQDYVRSELVDDIDAVPRDQDFMEFAQSTNLEDILEVFSKIRERLLPDNNNNASVDVSTFKETFPPLMQQLTSLIPHRYSELFVQLNTKSQAPEYRNNSAALGQNVLIIGINFFFLSFCW